MVQLWTEKYKPKKLSEMLSQEKPAKEAADFVESFKKGKALLLCGPPGCGKTLLAELLAKEKNLHLMSIDASEKRNAEEIETIFSGAAKNRPLFWRGRIILIDEADGIAPTDRGAMGAIAKIIKESSYPVILIANDAYAPKLRDIRKYCKVVKLNRVNVLSIAKKLKEIAQAEGITIAPEIALDLAKWSNGDVRSALIDFQIVSSGKKEVKQSDFEFLGYRERLADVFGSLPVVFFSGSINAGRKAIREMDKDPDEVLWWIETNIPKIYKDADNLALAYDLLSKADIMKRRIQKQQNWRFKAYMTDLLAGLSAVAHAKKGFVMFQPPDRFIQMGATKVARAEEKEMLKQLALQLHCSSKIVREEYMPYLKILTERDENVAKELVIEVG